MNIIDDLKKEMDDFENNPLPPIEHHYAQPESFSRMSFVTTDKWTNWDNSKGIDITCASDNILEVYAWTTGCDYSHNGQHNAHTEIYIPCGDSFKIEINDGVAKLIFDGNSEINTMSDCLFQLASFLRENNLTYGKD